MQASKNGARLASTVGSGHRDVDDLRSPAAIAVSNACAKMHEVYKVARTPAQEASVHNATVTREILKHFLQCN